MRETPITLRAFVSARKKLLLPAKNDLPVAKPHGSCHTRKAQGARREGKRKGKIMATKNEKGQMPARLGSAAAVCEERLGDIGALLDQIGQELNARFKPIEEAGVDWASAGDLGRVRENLIETLQGLCAFSREEIEATLAELRG
jgi:hypothetical protein